MTEDMAAKISQMQTKRQPMPRVWQENDGTWGHKYEYHARFSRRCDAEMAARWCEEWGCK
jgi:hypothetical protein